MQIVQWRHLVVVVGVGVVGVVVAWHSTQQAKIGAIKKKKKNAHHSHRGIVDKKQNDD